MNKNVFSIDKRTDMICSSWLINKVLKNAMKLEDIKSKVSALCIVIHYVLAEQLLIFFHINCCFGIVRCKSGVHNLFRLGVTLTLSY
jgi:hypothetical protein